MRHDAVTGDDRRAIAPILEYYERQAEVAACDAVRAGISRDAAETVRNVLAGRKEDRRRILVRRSLEGVREGDMS